MRRWKNVLVWAILAGTIGITANADGIWMDVPFVKQIGNGCGAAVISMVMQYWAREEGSTVPVAADPQGILQALYSREAKGIYASDMEQYFQRHGFRTFVFAADWTDLEHHVSKGRPLIVSLSVNGEGRLLHYVVVAGLDSQQGIVLLNDPARKKLLRISRPSFEKMRVSTNEWTLLVLPQQGS